MVSRFVAFMELFMVYGEQVRGIYGTIHVYVEQVLGIYGTIHGICLSSGICRAVIYGVRKCAELFMAYAEQFVAFVELFRAYVENLGACV
ncbi:hypothetical protein CEXT_598201 [Caerostris extrusa]|uniref:Uncharacterized protein n=1 Tax=Caerostris extrusa TaxID=172846 RepID=A0AAV4X5C6_CAEEX|nr:hypothetical protein CEXT_598201 [Caerostris extrusa]